MEIHLKPFVSMCIAADSEAEYVHKCLDSALSQRFGEYKLVLVDHALTDQTFVIAQERARRDDTSADPHLDQLQTEL